jgi:hypothetical protein
VDSIFILQHVTRVVTNAAWIRKPRPPSGGNGVE